ncbi:MAG: HNH endonuclease [Burkholderiales bacterium]|jgi:putative restriction endonuclease|nr:HNH endonuclease [Burkholderiales bacterium]
MPTKNWEHAAGILWPLLTAAAARKRTPTYQELAPRIGTNPLSVGKALSPIQDYCLEERLPPLTSIVVGKYNQMPGTGFIAWDISDLDSAHRLVFSKDWRSVQNPFSDFGPDDSAISLADELVTNPSASADVYAKVKVRGVAQIIFRKALLKAYDQQCAVCGLTFEEALQACHIVPWQHASASQRLDPRNGILLCATHHRLFDAELMTISESFKVVYYDHKMTDGPYSAADKSNTVAWHGRSMYLPKSKALQPLVENLRFRHREQKWSSPP